MSGRNVYIHSDIIRC